MKPFELVVVIDDSDDDRYLAQRILRKGLARRVLELSSAADALALFCDASAWQSQCGDAKVVPVLLDINMPAMDGFELVVELSRRAPERVRQALAIFMFTSSDSEQDRKRARALDLVKGYIAKPLDAPSFRRAVAAAAGDSGAPA